MNHFIIVGVLVVGVSLTLQRLFNLDSNTFAMLNIILGIIGVYIVEQIKQKGK